MNAHETNATPGTDLHWKRRKDAPIPDYYEKGGRFRIFQSRVTSTWFLQDLRIPITADRNHQFSSFQEAKKQAEITAHRAR